MIHKVNIKSQIIELVDDIKNDALKTRHLQDWNFEIFTEHKGKLYNIFIEESKKVLNKFTLKDENFKLCVIIQINLITKVIYGTIILRPLQ